MSQNIYGVYPNSWPFIAESREIASLASRHLDAYWEDGWRHFGTNFFRSSLMVDGMNLKRQVALRIELGEFRVSKSQRRTLRRNADLVHEIGPCRPGEAEHLLFHRHKGRFAHNVPSDLSEFLGVRPAERPCPGLQLSVRREGRLVAASFFNIGERSCSSVYAVFDPEESRRRLGIYTMLLELAHAQEMGLDYYYSGYATIEPSCYDYKKGFSGLSYYDWVNGWRSKDEMAM